MVDLKSPTTNTMIILLILGTALMFSENTRQMALGILGTLISIIASAVLENVNIGDKK